MTGFSARSATVLLSLATLAPSRAISADRTVERPSREGAAPADDFPSPALPSPPSAIAASLSPSLSSSLSPSFPPKKNVSGVANSRIVSRECNRRTSFGLFPAHDDGHASRIAFTTGTTSEGRRLLVVVPPPPPSSPPPPPPACFPSPPPIPSPRAKRKNEATTNMSGS